MRPLFGGCLVAAGLGLVLLTCGIALGSERVRYADCCFVMFGGLIAVGGIALLLPRGRREDWDDGGEW